MVNIWLVSLFWVSISLLFMMLGLLSYRDLSSKDKASPFECGFDPMCAARVRFCMKFFLVGVIFLIFDVEVSLILPIPFSPLFVMLFLMILVVGLLYEWYYGGLEWMYVNWSRSSNGSRDQKSSVTHHMNNNGG